MTSAADTGAGRVSHAAAPYDINGDGFGDVVVADAFAAVSGKDSAGVLRVAFGSSVGLTGRVQVLTRDSPGIKGGRAGSQFGQGVVSADFDADGYADVAGRAYGDVQVVYGWPSGLTRRDQVFSMEHRVPEFSLLGPVLASGDFDADGFADLVVSSPGSEDIKGGLVVLRGSDRGLTGRGLLRLSRDTPGVSGKGFIDDLFGAGVAGGDVTGDGIDDLALTSQEDPGNGSLYVFAGSARGLQIAGHTYLNSDVVFGRWKLFLDNSAELTVADLDRDGFGDVVVGSSSTCRLRLEMENCGVVGVLPGSAGGPAGTGAYIWDLDTPRRSWQHPIERLVRRVNCRW
jgi:hypothetical protein